MLFAISHIIEQISRYLDTKRIARTSERLEVVTRNLSHH